MKSRRLPSFIAPLGILILFPLACERADHDVVRGKPGGDGDGDNPSVGGTLMGTGGAEATGGAPSSGGLPGAGGGTGGELPEFVLPNPFLETCSSMGGMGGMLSVGDPNGDLLIDNFDDMDNRVEGNGLSGRWESHNDGAEEGGMQSPLGGFRVPESTWTDMAFDTGRDGTGYSLHMTGSGFQLWGSGQNLYFAQRGNGLACLFDGSAYAGITFWARGSVRTESDDVFEQPRAHEIGKLRVKIVDLDVISNGGEELEPGATAGGRCDQEAYRCWDSPVSRVELSADCWQQYVLPFSEMKGLEWSKWDGDDRFDAENLDPAEIFQLAFEVSEKQEYEVWIDDISFYVEGSEPTPETMCP
jgi:hypothetical protein